MAPLTWPALTFLFVDIRRKDGLGNLPIHLTHQAKSKKIYEEIILALSET